VSVPSPLKTTHTEVSVLKHGTGRVLTDGSPAVIEYTVVDGTTGKVVQTSGYKGQTSPITVDSKNAAALGKALNCSRVGERLAVVMTQGALSGGSATTKKATAAAVVIVDVTDGFASRATGRPQLAADGMPAVVLAPSGAPGITVPSTDAPKKDSYHLLRKGSGAELTTKDTAVVKYTAVTWQSDSSVAGSSWTDGSGAVTVGLGSKSQVPAAIRDALVGHRAGDQVLAIINQSGSTYAYVFDVLGAMPKA
jgi:peptidylprolyl isomerase